jgi:hypothetical protein
MPSQWELAARLLLAGVLGAIIGFQREMYGKPAGLRTLALIGLGAGMFGVISLNGFLGNNADVIAAGVVTGVGFLGAGAILHRHGGSRCGAGRGCRSLYSGSGGDGNCFSYPDAPAKKTEIVLR